MTGESMFGFSRDQRKIIDMLLVGADSRTICARLRMPLAQYTEEISTIKKALGVRRKDRMLERLREIRDNPNMFIESLRNNPREWWQI